MSTPTTAGTYRWVATYNGDANNSSVSGVCGNVNELVEITNVDPTVTLTRSSNPTSMPQPGGMFAHTVVITSNEPVTINSLQDSIYGNLNGWGTCATGVTVPVLPGSYSCSYQGMFTGVNGDSQTGTVTAIVSDGEATPVRVVNDVAASGSSTVRITAPHRPPHDDDDDDDDSGRPHDGSGLPTTGADSWPMARLGGLLLLLGWLAIAGSRLKLWSVRPRLRMIR